MGVAKPGHESGASLLPDPDLLFGEREIGEFLRVHHRMVGKLMKRGMPYRRVGLRPVASRAALREWIGRGDG
jgi:hypothetical protein